MPTSVLSCEEFLSHLPAIHCLGASGLPTSFLSELLHTQYVWLLTYSSPFLAEDSSCSAILTGPSLWEFSQSSFYPGVAPLHLGA